MSLLQQNNRILFVDFAKAIAIILMVTCHSTYRYLGFNSFIGAFHMAVFFFIAGLFAKGRDQSIKSTVSKSFFQLIIPYYIFSFVGLFYGWVYPFLHPEIFHSDRTFVDIFSKALTGIILMRDRVTSYAFHPAAALWFLSALFWCRVVFSIWIHSSKKYFYLARFLIIGALVTLYLYEIDLFALNSMAVMFPFFLLGFYTNKFVIRDFSSVNSLYFLFLGIFCLSSMFLLIGHDVGPDAAEINGNVGLAYLRGIMGIMMVMSFAVILQNLNLKLITKYLKYVGEATLTILGLHLAGIILFKTIIVSLGVEKELIPLSLAIPSSVLICLIGAWIHHKFLSKYAPLAIGKKPSPKKQLLVPLSS